MYRTGFQYLVLFVVFCAVKLERLDALLALRRIKYTARQ